MSGLTVTAPAARNVPPGRRGRLLATTALAAAGALILVGGPAGPGPGDAGDRYRAGEPATVRSTVPAAEVGRIRARALAQARTLGVPVGVRTQLARVVDRFAGGEFDEVVTTDGAGRRLGIVRTDRNGRLAMAVHLGWAAPAGSRIDEAGARARGIQLATAAGINGEGPPTIARAVDGGWRVAWARVIDGVPVVGDGSVVTLFGDGSFHAAARTERRLAAAPTTRLVATDVAGIAERHLRTLLGGSSSDARIVASRLSWIAPNDTFAEAGPDAPDPVLRLAWVVEARTVAPLSERVRALELYVDAGDGSLLGGDLLR